MGTFDASSLYWVLLEGAASHPMVLKELIASRRFNRKPSLQLTPFLKDHLDVLHMVDAFPQEHEILDLLLAVDGVDTFPRLSAVLKVVADGQSKRLKTIVFSDAPGVADHLAHALDSHLPGAVLRYTPGAFLDSFLEQKGPRFVLICDRFAEEGINLQSVRAQVVHLDLPYNPGRLEQRMGRIDRFGARVKAVSIIFEDENPLASAWLRCLQDVIQVFNRSIASLQYTLEEHLFAFKDTIFEEGVEAIEDLIILIPL